MKGCDTILGCEIETIVLRYRDLSSKNTIKIHNDKIASKGFVWWGWWAKPQEKVALEVFKSLAEKAISDTHFEVFLLDSGRSELRRAQCIDIKFDFNNPIPSPQKNATPAYYNKNKYLMWFKFDKISEPIDSPDKDINNYSYVQVDEHFASKTSPFSVFNNKKVYNLNELIEQQCTIWFLRKAKTDDENRQIVSYAPGNGNVETSFSIANTNQLLWLSDLHFSDNHFAFKKSVGSNNQIFDILKNKLDSIKFKKFSKVIVSGDITFSADEKEFAEAKNFFCQMTSGYGTDGESYIFCPGNHDMKYSEKDYEDNSPIELNYDKAKNNYIDFYEKVKGITANKYNNNIHRFVALNGTLVEIIALNTCILQQDREHFRGMGFAGNNQLFELRNALKVTDKMNALRILVMHHNLLPVIYSEEPKVNPMYSMLLDSEAISQFCIQNNILLVLHGHTHKNFYVEMTRKCESKDDQKKTIYVIGLGSTGASKSDLTDGYNNQFATIQIEEKILKLNIYELFPSGSNEKTEPICKYIIPFGG